MTYVSIPNATVFPARCVDVSGGTLGFGSGVVDSENRFIPLSYSLETVQEGFSGRMPTEIDDSRVVYGGFINQKGWGHFILQAITRLWYYFEHDEEVDKYVFTVIQSESTELRGNFKRFFELFGIADKLVVLNSPKRYREVVVPEISFWTFKYYHDAYNHILDHVIQQALQQSRNHKHPERIFLSRSHFKKARAMEIGVDFLDHYFERNGYVIIHPEEYDLADLINIMHSAKKIASPSGSIAHNIIFAPQGARFTIVDRSAEVNNYQIDVDIIRKLDTTYIDGNYMIYPVSVASGPCWYAYTDCFKSFTESQCYLPPDEKYTSDSHICSCFKQYMESYRKNYCYLIGIVGEWQLRYLPAVYEAYEDVYKVVGVYLRGEKVYKWQQFFTWRMFKRMVKNALELLR